MQGPSGSHFSPFHRDLALSDGISPFPPIPTCKNKAGLARSPPPIRRTREVKLGPITLEGGAEQRAKEAVWQRARSTRSFSWSIEITVIDIHFL